MIDYQKAVIELRDKLILTQSELANLLGVSFASINRWERGQNKPTTAAKRKIVELCNETKLKLKRRRNNVRKRRIFD